jgi:nucleoporin NUP82
MNLQVLKLGSGISGRINQLSISPFGDYMAVVTSHTVHVVVLHNHNHYELDVAPAPLRTFHLGPSQHVVERAPLVSVLWHPLSPFGRCLVTITADAVVRLWELDRENRMSFQHSELSIDLGRLANAGSAEDDLSASEFGRGASYMPDRAYLQPTAAAFGGTGRAGENPWSAMTLWVATGEGDLYALCPLIPTKFRASPGLIRNLWASITARRNELDQESETFEGEFYQLKQQEEWLRKVEEIEPSTHDNPDGRLVDVLTRPKRPEPVPFLQGPFELPIWEPRITDILVRNVCLGDEPLEFETGEVLEDDDDEDIVPLDTSVILLLSEVGSVHVLLGLQGIEGRWFNAHQIDMEEPEDSPLVHVVTFLAHQPTTLIRRGFFSSFTPDPMSQYAFFITHKLGVSHFSLEPWIERLRDGLEDPSDDGADFRAELFAKNVKPYIDKLITFPMGKTSRPGYEISACLAMMDDDLGYMVISSIHGEPFAVTLDTKHREVTMNASVMSQSGNIRPRDEQLALPAPPIRAPYSADNQLWELSEIPRFLREFPARSKIPLSQNSQLTTETLDGFIQAHQAFSRESQQLSKAAAGIFQACDRMLNEYHDQLQTVRETASKIDSITGNDEEVFSEDIEDHGHVRLQRRVEAAKERQERLVQKAKEVSKKLGLLGGGKQKSEKQKAFTAEVDSLASQLGLIEKNGKKADSDDDSDSEDDQPEFLERVEEVKALSKELKEDTKKISSQSGAASPRRQRVPVAMRKEKMDQVKELLDMESSMMEATADRLNRLSIQI